MRSDTGTVHYATNHAVIQRLRSADRLAWLAAAHIRAATAEVRRPFNRSIHLWLLAFGVGGFTYFGIHAVLFNLYLLRLGFQPAFIGLLIGSGQIIWALAALPAGELGRRVGVRGAFTFGLVLLGAAYAFLLCVEALPPSVWIGWLLVWWALVWVGAGLVTVNSIPYAMSLAGDSAPRAFAVQAAVIGMTSFVGSLAGAALLGVVADWTGSSMLEPRPYRIVLWLTPLAFLASGAAMLAAEPCTQLAPSRTTAASRRSPFGLFVLLALTVFLFAAGDGTLRAFFNVYLDTTLASTPVQIGVTMGLAQILPAVAALAVPALVARFGSAGTLSLASVVSAGGLVVVGTIPLLLVAGIAYMVSMSMSTIYGATRNLFSQQLVDVPWRTTAAAILTVGVGSGWAGSAVIGGSLVGVVGFTGLFYLSAALTLTAGVIAWGYQRAARQRMPVSTIGGDDRWPGRTRSPIGGNHDDTVRIEATAGELRPERAP